jgi:hypothetical protein
VTGERDDNGRNANQLQGIVNEALREIGELKEDRDNLTIQLGQTQSINSELEQTNKELLEALKGIIGLASEEALSLGEVARQSSEMAEMERERDELRLKLHDANIRLDKFSWRKVDTDPPELETRVLISDYDGWVATSDYSMTGPYGKKQKSPVFNDDQDEQPGTYLPSHWMPLPESAIARAEQKSPKG